MEKIFENFPQIEKISEVRSPPCTMLGQTCIFASSAHFYNFINIEGGGKGIFLKILFPGLYKIEEFAFRNSQNPSEIPQKKKKASHDELFKTTVCATVYLNTLYLVILKLHRFTICLLAIK